MAIEAEFALGDWTNPAAPTDDPGKSGIFVRLSVVHLPGDRPLDDHAENAVKLSFDQARSFAESILKLTAEAETRLKEIERL